MTDEQLHNRIVFCNHLKKLEDKLNFDFFKELRIWINDYKMEQKEKIKRTEHKIEQLDKQIMEIEANKIKKFMKKEKFQELYYDDKKELIANRKTNTKKIRDLQKEKRLLSLAIAIKKTLPDNPNLKKKAKAEKAEAWQKIIDIRRSGKRRKKQKPPNSTSIYEWKINKKTGKKIFAQTTLKSNPTFSEEELKKIIKNI